MAKIWRIKDADPYFYRLGVRRATRGLPFADDKSPARAFTFSLLFCGAGQSYSGQRMKAVLFETVMLLLLIGAAFALMLRKELLSLLSVYGIPFTRAFIAMETGFFCLLVFWIWNAADAYLTTAKARRVPFRGVESTVLPTLSSLLLPGWGQFMNGQPRKGVFFSVFSVLNIFSLGTIAAVLLTWPVLEPVRARIFVEVLFTASLLYAPVIPLISLVSSYDALRVCRDATKKETLLDRILLAVTRVRIEGWYSAFRSPARALLAVMVLTGLIIAAKPHVQSLLSYYSSRLADAQAWSQKQGMTVLPALIARMLARRTATDNEPVPMPSPNAIDRRM